MEIVDGKNYLPEVRKLIEEYSNRLGRDLSFQNIDIQFSQNRSSWIRHEF